MDGVRLYADYARTHRWFGAPGSDHHGDARIHASLAHLYGRDRVWIEAFHSSGWGGTLEETFDWLLPWLRAGATLYNPHAAYYTTRGGWWEWAPPSTDWRQPYWAHHRVFADAVARLCAALSLGRHVCDVAVLLPTATAQAGTRLDGVEPSAALAQETYRALVGDMAWFQMVPGVLDRLRVDADVIDDDSVQRATVTGGRLDVAGESYGTVLLPACTVLEGETARRLVALAERGGRVVSVGPVPRHGVGDPAAGEAVARLATLVETVPDAGSLGPLLEGSRRVEAPVPALVREVDGATVVFLTAAESMASRVSVGRPDERGADLGWLDVTYDFDPGRYHRGMRVRVHGVTGPALLAAPSAARRGRCPQPPCRRGWRSSSRSMTARRPCWCSRARREARSRRRPNGARKRRSTSGPPGTWSWCRPSTTPGATSPARPVRSRRWSAGNCGTGRTTIRPANGHRCTRPSGLTGCGPDRRAAGGRSSTPTRAASARTRSIGRCSARRGTSPRSSSTSATPRRDGR
ncbi:hypothetical protein [Actinomadura madurae]|uniref:hypothetical protein n=1 Tax=Actinomadura madurae TaxID=1993 RepID=UPI0020D23C9C|nr:hypothetical protein [Actinomadura madurae]MCP9979061.1 hypothetical protein [Actinomadura madurae]